VVSKKNRLFLPELLVEILRVREKKWLTSFWTKLTLINHIKQFFL
jgi:hypothetical protein